MTDDSAIETRMQRVEDIIRQIEAGDLTVVEGKQLLEEAREHIEELEGLLEGDEDAEE